VFSGEGGGGGEGGGARGRRLAGVRMRQSCGHCRAYVSVFAGGEVPVGGAPLLESAGWMGPRAALNVRECVYMADARAPPSLCVSIQGVEAPDGARVVAH
jgi:hypothetical protein